MTFVNDSPSPALESGGNDPTEEQQAPVFDLVADYQVPGLDSGKLQALGMRLRKEIQEFNSATSARRDLARLWRRDEEMLPADSADLPWENASNLRAPLTTLGCKDHSRRLNSQFGNSDPAFSVIARSRAAQDAAPVIQDVLQAVLDECNWKAAMRECHRELPITANCLVRVQWRTKRIMCPQHNYLFDDEQAQQDIRSGTHPVQAIVDNLQRDRSGRLKMPLRWVERTIFDGPEITVVPYSEMIVLPASASKPEDLWALGERVRISGLDLLQGMREGRYFEDAVRELLSRNSDHTSLVSDEDEDEYLMGVSNSYSGADTADPLTKSFEFAEMDWQGDLDRTNTRKWYILTVHIETGKIIRCMYSPYEHGRSRYTMFRYDDRPGKLWGRSIAEILATVQDAATSSANNIINYSDQLAGMAGNFWYDTRSGYNPSNSKFAPGIPQKVLNVDGIKPMNEQAAALAPAMQVQLEVLELLKGWMELITGSSNPGLGKTTDATKTLGEVKLVLGNAMAAFEDYASGVALSWREVADKVRWCVAQCGDPEDMVEYRVSATSGAWLTGPNGQPSPGAMVWLMNPRTGMLERVPVQGNVGFGRVPAALLKSEVSFWPAGLNAFVDQQTRVQRSMMVLEAMDKDPMIASLPEVKLLAWAHLLQDARVEQREEILTAMKEGIQKQAEQAAAAGQLQEMVKLFEQAKNDLRAMQAKFLANEAAAEADAAAQQQVAQAQAEAAVPPAGVPTAPQAPASGGAAPTPPPAPGPAAGPEGVTGEQPA